MKLLTPVQARGEGITRRLRQVLKLLPQPALEHQDQITRTEKTESCKLIEYAGNCTLAQAAWH